MADNTALRSNILIALNWRSVQDGVAFLWMGGNFVGTRIRVGALPR